MAFIDLDDRLGQQARGEVKRLGTSRDHPLYEETLERARNYVLAEHPTLLGQSIFDIDAKAALVSILDRWLSETDVGSEAAYPVADDLVGYGPLDPYLKDPEVTDIMVNGPASIYVEKSGKRDKIPVSFASEGALMQMVKKMCNSAGSEITERTPTVDAKLPDGSRINAVVPPASLIGPRITIRKHRRFPVEANFFISQGTMDQSVAEFLRRCVEGRLNIIVAGPTGAGKTALLRFLGSLIPDDARVVTIEQVEELRLSLVHPHVVASEETQHVRVYDLLVNSLREYPEYIIVGEVRDREGPALVQAANTGHAVMTTLHAEGPRDQTIARLAMIYVQQHAEVSVLQVRGLLAQTVNIIIYCRYFRNRDRRVVTNVVEVCLGEDGSPAYNEIFRYNQQGPGFEQVGSLSPATEAKLLLYQGEG